MIALANDLAADEIALLPVANHLTAANSTERPQRRHQINGLENIGLSLGIVAKEQMETGWEIGIEPRVVAEITKTNAGQMHRDEMPQETSNSKLQASGKALACVAVVVLFVRGCFR